MEKVLIYVDSRELNSGINIYFEQFNCDVQSKMLVYGDYIVSDRVCIERKATGDFIQSIIDKRLFKQLAAMKENFEKPVLIIEGGTLYDGRLQPNAIRGALVSIAIDYKIPIIWTKDPADTAGIIFWLARREQFLEKREISFRNKKTKLTTKEQQEFLISGLPNISVVRAKDLLKHFENPESIFAAEEKDLKEVGGIGKKIAEDIRKVLKKKYK